MSGIRFSGLPIGPHIRAEPAASLTGKLGFQIRQAHVIRPSIAADRSPVTAMIIGAVDQESTHARGAHFCEGDFLGPVEHAP
jgi:hypothetical protein